MDYLNSYPDETVTVKQLTDNVGCSQAFVYLFIRTNPALLEPVNKGIYRIRRTSLPLTGRP